MVSKSRTAESLGALHDLYAQIMLTREGLPELIASQHQFETEARRSIESLIRVCLEQFLPRVQAYNARANEFSLARQWLFVAMLKERGMGWDSKTGQFLSLAEDGPFYALEVQRSWSSENLDETDSDITRVLRLFVTRSDRDQAVCLSPNYPGNVDTSILPVVLNTDTIGRRLALDQSYDWHRHGNPRPEFWRLRVDCEYNCKDVFLQLPVPPELAKEYGLPEDLDTLGWG